MRSERYRAKVTLPLRVYRVAAGLSMRELADAAGVSELTIWRLEAGKSKPNPATATVISQALDVSAEQLFPPAQSAPNGQPGAHPG